MGNRLLSGQVLRSVWPSTLDIIEEFVRVYYAKISPKLSGLCYQTYRIEVSFQ